MDFTHFPISSPTMSSLILFFALLGVVPVAKFVATFLHCLYVYFLRRPIDLKSRYGTWAIVTGPTDGIGKAIAFELARKKLNLVLVGRNPDKLDAVAARISDEYGDVRVKTVVVDLSEDLVGPMETLKAEIEGLDVGVLVNNAAVGTTHPKYFHEWGMDAWMEVIKVNLRAVTEVTRAVMGGMIERRRGAVVNIGSGSGSTVGAPTFPLFDVYAGTKAYVDQFSQCLSVEYKSKGIDVQCQIPMYVDTKMVAEMFDVHWHSFFVASPRGYTRAAMRFIGYERLCIPYFLHFLQCRLIHMVPDFILFPVILYLNMNQRKHES